VTQDNFHPRRYILVLALGPGFFGPGRPGPLTLGPRTARPGPNQKSPGWPAGFLDFFCFLKEFLTSSFHRNIKNQSLLVNFNHNLQKIMLLSEKTRLVCKKIS
jgi:hypothetical protein